jgi:hypothetical protein
MGFIDPLTPEQQSTLPFPFLFNVVRAVGKNCPNLEDDVKLVHYLLIKFYDVGGRSTGGAKPNGVISFESGAYSDATENWITKAQIDINFFAGLRPTVAMDKRVDRIRSKDNLFQSSLTKTTYTLAALNSFVQRFDPLGFLALPAFVPVVVGSVPEPSPDFVKF